MNLRDLLCAQLRSLGVSRVVGAAPLVEADAPADFWLGHLVVDDADLACLLADVDGRINGGFGAALLSGGLLHLSSQPGGRSPVHGVASAEELLAALALVSPSGAPTTLALHLDLDLDEPVALDLARPEVARGVLLRLDESLADLSLAVVVGPGVIRSGAAEGLAVFADQIGVPVFNTWGAKGVFRWDDSRHGGTVGLQALDLVLAGIDRADVVITSGLDPAELGDDLAGSTVQDVDPVNLISVVAHWARRTPVARPPLYDALAAVTVPAYEDASVPLSAPRAALHLSGAVLDGGIVVADPGLAGFWVARTFPTAKPGTAVVPALHCDGFAAAASLLSALDGRPCLAVTDRFDPVSEAVIGLAESLSIAATLQIWGDDGGSIVTTADHVELCARQLASSTVRIDDVPVRLDPAALTDVAGPISAWGGVRNN